MFLLHDQDKIKALITKGEQLSQYEFRNANFRSVHIFFSVTFGSEGKQAVAEFYASIDELNKTLKAASWLAGSITFYRIDAEILASYDPQLASAILSKQIRKEEANSEVGSVTFCFRCHGEFIGFVTTHYYKRDDVARLIISHLNCVTMKMRYSVYKTPEEMKKAPAPVDFIERFFPEYRDKVITMYQIS